MSAYAWKNWYRAALFLVLSMAIVERPDFPKQVFGIPGFNPWNLLMFTAVLAYMVDKSKSAEFRVAPTMKFLMVFYPTFILIAFLREIGDLSGIIEFAAYLGAKPMTARGIFIDDFVNTIKYMVPGFLIYFGCNNKLQIREAAIAILAMNFMLALLTIKSMGFDALGSGSEMEQTAIRRLDRDVGYFRSDLAILLAGGGWAIFALSRYVESRLLAIALLIASGICALAIGLSGGRMGMAAWGILALCFGALRWKSILIYGPLLFVLVVSFVPAVQDRFMQGIGDSETSENASEGDIDMSSVTSGRSIIWPEVIDEIMESPFLGHGRRAMQRIGLSQRLGEDYDKPFAHPHNAYLQLLLDNGLLIGIPVLLLFLSLLKSSLKMMLDKSCSEFPLVGSISFAFILSFLVGAIAQQSFYPFIGSVSLWASVGLLLRVTADKDYYTGSLADSLTGNMPSQIPSVNNELQPLWLKR
ncbi:MAG: O-antigen ligase [Candidatus Azotimanducaceae bacterium]|jgi:O-antigen ligase